MAYRWLIPFLWLVFITVGIAMARSPKAIAERESAYSRPRITCRWRSPYISSPRPRFPSINDRFAPSSLWPVRLGAALSFAGVAFAIGARTRLAGNWSSGVTLKRDHELVVDGPYRGVRHPIYTGILVALIGTALAVGEWRGTVVLAAAAFWRKLRIEEAVMRRKFGQAYAKYAERVPALIPFVL